MIGLGLGLGMSRGGIGTAPDYVAPDGDTPVDPPIGDPDPPTDTPTDPDTGGPGPGIDPDFVMPTRIDITDSGQTAVRTTNDPGTFGVAYVATPVSGDEYWEYEIQTPTPNNATFAVGITTLDMPLNGIPGVRATEIAWWSDGTVRQNNATLIDLGAGGALARGDTAGIAIDTDGAVFLYKNCVALNSGTTVGTLAPVDPIYPFVALYSAKTKINMNFSNSTFNCAVPSGFYPIGQVPLPAITALTTVESGTWIVPDGVTLLSEVLIVAGGGGGGSRNGATGGGGAGGYIYLTDVTVTPGASIAYTVGAGGAGAPDTSALQGSNGGNSVFGTDTAVGGGGGGGNVLNMTGLSGGGGGGGGSGGPPGTNYAGGTGTSGQGFAGGTGFTTGGGGGVQKSAGGGGAGAVGESGDNLVPSGAPENGASGGVGVFFASFVDYGDSGYFGGGGGAGAVVSSNPRTGAGGLGGGGDGGAGVGTNTSSNGQNGMANTGGGGGGVCSNGAPSRAGGSGGSGVILIKY